MAGHAGFIASGICQHLLDAIATSMAITAQTFSPPTDLSSGTGTTSAAGVTATIIGVGQGMAMVTGITATIMIGIVAIIAVGAITATMVTTAAIATTAAENITMATMGTTIMAIMIITTTIAEAFL
jgi:hypothetical protein